MSTHLSLGSEGFLIATESGGVLIESCDEASTGAIVKLLRAYFGVGVRTAKQQTREDRAVVKWLAWLAKARRKWRADRAAEHATLKRARNRSLAAAAHRLDFH